MMTNPLREDYIRRKRWCEKGLANLGKRGREKYTRGKEREIAKKKEAQHLARDSMANTLRGIRFKLGCKFLHLGC